MQETVRYIKESERDRGVPVVPVDAMLGTFGIEELCQLLAAGTMLASLRC